MNKGSYAEEKMSRVFASERNRFLLANIKCDIVALRISQNKHQNRMTC